MAKGRLAGCCRVKIFMRFQTVKEGISTILLPLSGEVFYNPVQEFNRDLSVLVVSKYAQHVQEKRGVWLGFAFGQSDGHFGRATSGLKYWMP
jgi:tRNA G26 N,N-dimethylase Trm1